MHKYYKICKSDSIWQTASAKLPWSHIVLIFHRIEDKTQRLWYINETAKAGWSYDTLAMQIKTVLIELGTGLILCREKDRLTVEYALKDVNKPIGVSSYEIQKYLPSEEDINLHIGMK